MLFEEWKAEKEKEFTTRTGEPLPVCIRLMISYYKRTEGKICGHCAHFSQPQKGRTYICRKEINPGRARQKFSPWEADFPACGLFKKEDE